MRFKRNGWSKESERMSEGKIEDRTQKSRIWKAVDLN
jgi:hypothetical protein